MLKKSSIKFDKELFKRTVESNVKMLLCSHIWGGGYTDSQIAEEAQRHFPSTEVAQELKIYSI